MVFSVRTCGVLRLLSQSLSQPAASLPLSVCAPSGLMLTRRNPVFETAMQTGMQAELLPFTCVRYLKQSSLSLIAEISNLLALIKQWMYQKVNTETCIEATRE